MADETPNEKRDRGNLFSVSQAELDGGILSSDVRADEGTKLVRGINYAPDSFDDEENGTGEYDDSANSEEGIADVVEALNDLASRPESAFRSDRAVVDLLQLWLPIVFPAFYAKEENERGAILRKAKEEHGVAVVQAALFLAGEQEVGKEE